MLFMLLLMTEVVEKQPDTSPQKQDTQPPDAEVLLFLAEWSDEDDQWLDPDLFDQPPEINEISDKQKVTENEQDPHIN